MQQVRDKKKSKVRYECCFYDMREKRWSTDCAFDDKAAAIRYIADIASTLDYVDQARVINSDTREIEVQLTFDVK